MAGQALAAFSAGLLGTPRPHAQQPSSTLSLPDDLLLHIARYLHPNDIACSLRPACKHSAALFPRAPHTTTVHLSHPVPHHAFHRRWCSRAALHSLPRKQRTTLCCLTARSGSLPNLSALLSRTSLPLEPSVFTAAAAAGHVHICRFLKRKGCPHDKGDLMEAAISSGQLNMCTWLCSEMGCRPRRTDIVTATTAGHRHVAEWLLQTGSCTRHAAAAAAAAAARAGHVLLYTWLRGQLQAQERYFACGLHLLDLAQGCPLGVLRSAYDSFVAAGGGRPPEDCVIRQLPSHAAMSRTADWRDKVVWAEEAAGAPRVESACEQAMSCPDALERLLWLHARGYPLGGEVVTAAARHGRVQALQYALSHGSPVSNWAPYFAAVHGHVGSLQVLSEHVGAVGAGAPLLSQIAASNGHRPVVEWFVQTHGREAILSPALLRAAVRSKQLELMQWLRQEGCPWSRDVFTLALSEGTREQVQWLAAQGCPMGCCRLRPDMLLSAARRAAPRLLRSCLPPRPKAAPSEEQPPDLVIVTTAAERVY